MAEDIKPCEFGVLEIQNAEGCDQKVYPLKPGPFAIGSSVNAAIRLGNDTQVQDLHCIVHVQDNGVATLSPQAVFHPTILNNKEMRKNKSTLLKPGDIFDVGNAKILYRNDSITEEDLQQRGKFSAKPKRFRTPHRGSVALARTATMTHSIKKKLPSVSRRGTIQKRRASASALKEYVFTNWSTDIMRSDPLPSSHCVPSDVSESGNSSVDMPSSSSSKVSESGIVTPSPRSIKRVSSQLLTDSNDSRRSLSPRNSMRSIKTEASKILPSGVNAPKTVEKSSEELARQVSIAEKPGTSAQCRETPRTISGFSKYDNDLLFGEPTKLTKSRSCTYLTASLSPSKPEKKNSLRSKSFSNRKTETSSTVNLKTPNSAVKRSSKHSKTTKGDIKMSPPGFPSSGIALRRSLSAALRHSAGGMLKDVTINKSLEKDIEQVSSSYDESRSSRDSTNDAFDKSDDIEQAIPSLVQTVSTRAVHRSRSPVTASKPSESSTFNISVKDNDQTVSSLCLVRSSSKAKTRRSRSPLITSRKSIKDNEKASLSTETESSVDSVLKKLNVGTSLKDVQQNVSSPVASSVGQENRRSRSRTRLSTASRRSANISEKLKNSSQSSVSTFTDGIDEDASVVAHNDQSFNSDASSGENKKWESTFDDISTTLDSSLQSSVVESMDSSSFIFENPAHAISSSSLQHCESVLNVSGIEELTKTPKQEVKVRSSKKSSRKSTAKVEENALNTYMQNLSVEDSLSVESAMSPDILRLSASSESALVSADDNLAEIQGNLEFLKEQTAVTDNREKSLKVSKELKTPNDDISNVRGIKQTCKTPRLQKLLKKDLSDVSGIKRIMATPEVGKNGLGKRKSVRQLHKSPKNDLSDVKGVKRIMKTPKAQKSPKNDLSDVKGVKKLMETPKAQKSPKNDISNPHGVKKLFEEPKIQKSPKNDLSDVKGVKNLMKTPKAQRSPKNDISNPHGVKKLFEEPKIQKSPKNDLSDVKGVKNLMKTPKAQRSPKNDISNPHGVKKLFEESKIQKSPKNDLSDVKGVKTLMKTPKAQRSPKNDISNPHGVKKLFEEPKTQKSPKNDLSDVTGIKGILKTPKTSKSSKNDLSNLYGSKKLSVVPEAVKSPKNDLSKPHGVKKLLATPKHVQSPKHDASDVTDVQRLTKTPKASKLSKNSSKDVSGVDELFTFGEILNTMQVTKTDDSRQSVLSSKKIREKTSNSDYSDVAGVKRLFAEEEAASRNVANVSGVADLFNESATASASEVFTTLFNKKPLRTYRSQTPSPHVLNRLRKNQKNVHISPTVSPHVVDWINSVNKQFGAEDRDIDSEIPSPKKGNLDLKISVPMKHFNRLASETSAPNKNLDSRSPTDRLRSVQEKLPADMAKDAEPEEETSVKKITRSILKQTVGNSNTNSPVASQKRTRKTKDVAETIKENLTPDPSEVASDIQPKKVTFVVLSEETRRSKRTPRKPVKYSEDFVSDLEEISKLAKDKEDQHTQKRPLSSEKEEKEQVPIKPATRKRGIKTVTEETSEADEATIVKRLRGKQEVTNQNIDQLLQTRGESNIKNKKLRARKRPGKQEILNEKVDQIENKKSEAVMQEDEEDKKLPVKRHPRRQAVDVSGGQSNNESEAEVKKDLEKEKRPKKRGRKPVTDKVDQPEIELETHAKFSNEEKPLTRRGQQQSKQNDDQAEFKELVVNITDLKKLQASQKPVDQSENKKLSKSNLSDCEYEKPLLQRRARRNPMLTEKVNQPEDEETKEIVKTRGRKQQVANEQIDQPADEKSETKGKPVKRIGSKQAADVKTKQLELADCEVVISKNEVVEKPAAKRRGRKPAVKQQVMDSEESDIKSETTSESEMVSFRRMTRRGAAKRINYADDSDSTVSEEAERKSKRKRQVAEEVPIRKSARTRR